MRTSRDWDTIRKVNSMHLMIPTPRDKVRLPRILSNQIMQERQIPRKTRRMARTKRRRRARSQRRTRKRRMTLTMTRKIAVTIQTLTQTAQVKKRIQARRKNRRKRRARASWEKLQNLNVSLIKKVRSQRLANLQLKLQPSRLHLRHLPLQRMTCLIYSLPHQPQQINRHHLSNSQARATLALCNRLTQVSQCSSHPSKTLTSSVDLV